MKPKRIDELEKAVAEAWDAYFEALKAWKATWKAYFEALKALDADKKARRDEA